MRAIPFLGSAALAAILMITSAAHAQESSDDQRARLHFEAGRSYFEEGDYEQALDEFSRAYDLSHRDVLLVNIANCQERLGMWGQAADSLDAFLRSLPPDDEQRATMSRRIENLRERAAREPAGGTTTTTETTTETTTGSSATATGAGTTTGATVSDGATDGLLVPAVVAFAVGGAGLIAWGVLGGLALAEEGNVASGCGATVSCTPAEVQAMDDLALGADVSMVIGLVGVATGAVLILVAPPRGGSGESASASLTPYGGRDGAGLAVHGSF